MHRILSRLLVHILRGAPYQLRSADAGTMCITVDGRVEVVEDGVMVGESNARPSGAKVAASVMINYVREPAKYRF